MATALPRLRERHVPDLVIVNGENAAGGVGITPDAAEEIFEAGTDVITLGNHAYRHREAASLLGSDKRVVRPANHSPEAPGRGFTVVEAARAPVAVVNLSGEVYMRVAREPFGVIDEILDGLRGSADIVFVDFHAEVTSEKVAMGWHLDGRVAAVCGTHTHVPTADARVLPKGTAHISDVGMTGSRAGVIGVEADQALRAFRTQLPTKFDVASDDVWVMGCAIDVGDDGLARGIEQVLEPAAG